MVFVRHLDIILAVLVSLSAAILTRSVSGGSSPLTITLGLLLTLVIPGYMLVAALFPKRYMLHAGGRIALSLGLSFVMVATIGFLLSRTPWGIRPVPIAVALAAFTVLMAGVVVLRRLRLPPNEQFALLRFPLERDELRRVGVALVSLCVLGTVTSVALTFDREVRYTEFYLLGPGGDLTGYPGQLAAGAEIPLIFGVKNQEDSSLSYRLEWRGKTTPTLLATPTVPQGETWEQTITVQAPTSRGESRLEFDLYREGDTSPYRSLYLLVNVAADSGNPADPIPDAPLTDVQRTATMPEPLPLLSLPE